MCVHQSQLEAVKPTPIQARAGCHCLQSGLLIGLKSSRAALRGHTVQNEILSTHQFDNDAAPGSMCVGPHAGQMRRIQLAACAAVRRQYEHGRLHASKSASTWDQPTPASSRYTSNGVCTSTSVTGSQRSTTWKSSLSCATSTWLLYCSASFRTSCTSTS